MPKTIRLLACFVLAASLLTGCFSQQSAQPADTKAPSPQIGIVDMDKAIAAHPKYQELIKLQKQRNALQAELQARNEQANLPQPAEPAQPQQPGTDSITAGYGNLLEQDYQTKMTARQAELNTRLTAKADALRGQMTAEMNAYAQEVDKEYQPQLFSLQLKLQTLQLSKEQGTALQQQMNAIQDERSAKLAAKQKELAAKLDQAMAPERDAAQQELAAYGQQLARENQDKMNAKVAETAARDSAMASLGAAPAAPAPATGGDGRLDELARQIDAVTQQINELQNSIILDIRDQAGKVSAEQGLKAALTAVTVNVNAVDITDAVIAGFKK